MLGVLTLVVAAGAATAWVAAGDDSAPPDDRDFIAIEAVPRAPSGPLAGPHASTGAFISPCGINAHGHQNSDNMIGFPGARGAARHVHEYVGNLSTNAFSTDDTLAAAGTTCPNGDLSAYYWPVLRAVPGRGGTPDTHIPGEHGNHGARVPPASVLVEFRGNPTSDVVAMPRFLRAITGDARAGTAGPDAMGTARWSCTGSPDRHTSLYPLCPDGERVVRTLDFPSCWDGRRTDSDKHRAHLVFPAGGICPRNTFPVPQLRVQATYTVPSGASYAIDAFPEQRRSPTTDHGDFINVMPEDLMDRVVDCLNTGRHC
jgi:hypothetical protein